MPKKTSRPCLNVLAFAWLSSLSGFAQAAGAHVHGQAQLDIVVDGGALTLSLRSPLDSLLGFESTPRTAAQKTAAEALLQQLRTPEWLFVTTAAAQCRPLSSSVHAPVLGAGAAQAGGASKGGHAELSADFVFRCEQPQQLRSLELKLFEQFRGVKRVNAKLAGPRGQSSATLSPARPGMSW